MTAAMLEQNPFSITGDTDDETGHGFRAAFVGSVHPHAEAMDLDDDAGTPGSAGSMHAPAARTFPPYKPRAVVRRYEYLENLISHRAGLQASPPAGAQGVFAAASERAASATAGKRKMFDSEVTVPASAVDPLAQPAAAPRADHVSKRSRVHKPAP